MSFRYRLNPAPDQVEAMVRHCGHARLVWNLALEQMHTARQFGLRCDWSLWEPQLAELRNTDGFEWLAEGSSSVQQQALRQLRRAFMNFWSNPEHFRPPKFRSKSRTTEGFAIRDVSVRKINRKWSVVHVPKTGWVKFRRHRPLGDHGMAHVTRDRSGRWFVSFAAPQPAVERIPTGRSVGVDVGVEVTAATSDGELLHIPRPTAKERDRHRRLKIKVSQQQKGSRRRADTLRAIAKLEARWADRRRDWCEKTSLALVRDYDTITFENLRIPNMVRSAKGTVDAPGVSVAAKSGLNRSIQESCWGYLARRTQDKAEASGVAFVRVEAAYTSQRCSCCGHTDTANRPSRDQFVCDACGHEDHADLNSAKNLRAAGPVVHGRGKADQDVRGPSKFLRHAA